MVKLQCQNCFAELRPAKPHGIFQCTGCSVLYILERDELKLFERPKWIPEGYVEDPNGRWVSYYIYCWKDPNPPYIRHVGFKSATYEKETTIDLSDEILQNLGSMRGLEGAVRREVLKAVKEVVPPEFDIFEANLSYLFDSLPFLAPSLQRFKSKI